MSKFTPGPWAAFHDHPNPKTAKSIAYIRAADGSKRYEWGFPEIACCFGCKTPEQAANARLIASAPDLLAALQSVWLWMENQADAQSKGGHATFDLMKLREQRDIASAAIAKATGETP